MKRKIIVLIIGILILSMMSVVAENEGLYQDNNIEVNVVPVDGEYISLRDDEINIGPQNEEFVLNVEEALLVNEDEWNNVGNLKTQRADCNLLSVNGAIYAVGGMGDKGYIDTVEKYDETNNEWNIVTEIPSVPMGYSAVAVNNKIYIIGGYLDGVYLNTVKVYDIDTDNWNEVSTMIKRRSEAATVAVNNKIYIYGGRNTFGIVNNMECYDIEQNKWSETTTGLNDDTIRIGAKAFYLTGYVCIYGGVDKTGNKLGVGMYSEKNLKEQKYNEFAGYDDISVVCGKEKGMILAHNPNTDEYKAAEISFDNDMINSTDVDIKYNLNAYKYVKYIMNNGYLYAVGGYNIITGKCESNVSKYSVYYGNYEHGDGEVSSETAEAGNTVTLNVEAGKEYLLFINASNISSFDDCTFKIEYTDNAFDVTDGCAMTVENDTKIGSIDGTNIEIIRIGTDGISFISNEKLNSGETATTAVNAVILKANSSGRRRITYAMIKNS